MTLLRPPPRLQSRPGPREQCPVSLTVVSFWTLAATTEGAHSTELGSKDRLPAGARHVWAGAPSDPTRTTKQSAAPATTPRSDRSCGRGAGKSTRPISRPLPEASRGGLSTQRASRVQISTHGRLPSTLRACGVQRPPTKRIPVLPQPTVASAQPRAKRSSPPPRSSSPDLARRRCHFQVPDGVRKAGLET